MRKTRDTFYGKSGTNVRSSDSCRESLPRIFSPEPAGSAQINPHGHSLFESTDEVQYLDGSNVLSSENLVLVARLDGTERLETDEWTRFEIPFEVANGKTIDSDKLTKGGYNLSIVLSSSRDGASFNGAVGSTLYADELTLILDEE